jgi:hypothetical protein
MSVAVVAVATAALACGGGPPAAHVASAGGHATPTAAADQRTVTLQYTACMRAHGANVPDPTFDQQGNPQWPPGTDVKGSGNQAAAQACHPILQAVSSGSDPNHSPPTAAQLAQRTRLAQCMRQHGFPDFPDPDPQTGEFNGSGDLQNRPGAIAAAQACLQQVPGTGLPTRLPTP